MADDGGANLEPTKELDPNRPLFGHEYLDHTVSSSKIIWMGSGNHNRNKFVCKPNNTN
jgi:hypothetical protein